MNSQTNSFRKQQALACKLWIFLLLFIANMVWPFSFDKILFNSIKLDEQFVRAVAIFSTFVYVLNVYVCVCVCMHCWIGRTILTPKVHATAWETIAKFIHVEQTLILVIPLNAKKGASGGEHRTAKLHRTVEMQQFSIVSSGKNLFALFNGPKNECVCVCVLSSLSLHRYSIVVVVVVI